MKYTRFNNISKGSVVARAVAALCVVALIICLVYTLIQYQDKQPATAITSSVKKSVPDVLENPLRQMTYVPLPGSVGTSGVDRNGFWIDIYEITNKEYEQFDPSHKRFRGQVSSADAQPAIRITWEDAVAYCRWRCRSEKVPEGTYRLPTEEEWEYAARGGLEGADYPWGISKPYANDIPRANFRHGQNGATDIFVYTSNVGSFTPNGYGIYDMAGNVSELCHNVYSETGLPRRAIRGGSWGTPAGDFSFSFRHGMSVGHWLDNLGFRCIRED